MTKFKIAIYVAVFFTLVGLAWFAHHKIDQSGYDRCRSEYTAAMNDAKEEARGDLVKVEKKYEKKIKELQEAPDSDSGVGPLTTRAIDGL